MVEISEESLRNEEKRHDAGDLQVACLAGKEVVKGHAQWRNPDLKARRDATPASPVEGVNAAITARIAEECDRVLGQELTEEEEGWPLGRSSGKLGTERKSRLQRN